MTHKTLAPLAALILLACKGGTPTPVGDTDVGTPTPAGMTGTVACGAESAFWRITAPAGPVTVTVDTVDATTTFDPGAEAFAVATWPATPAELDTSSYVYLGGSDDAFECTFPPANYQCPSFEVTADGADFLLEIFAASTVDCVGADADYALTLSVGTAAFLGNVDNGAFE